MHRYVKQDPPKWLIHPIALSKESTIKVFDFTKGSLNNELRKTTDSSVNYEYEDMEDPILKHHKAEDLEQKIVKRQQKYLRRFQKEEESRVEEAKRSGSIIEERKLSTDSDEQPGVGMNEPLLRANNDNNQPLVQPNVANAVPRRVIFPGIVRQTNGTYRIC